MSVGLVDLLDARAHATNSEGYTEVADVQVVKVSPAGGEQAGRGVAFWRGTIAPQHEWGKTWSGAGREGATVPGGGPQILLDPAAAERGQLQVIDSFRLAPTGLPNRETKGEIDHH